MRKSNSNKKVELKARERFALCIKELRGGQSYRKFAQRIGIAHTSLTRWEGLEVEPDLENLEKIARMRGESVAEFKEWLEGKREPSPLQEMIQQMYKLSPSDLGVLMKAIADRIVSQME